MSPMHEEGRVDNVHMFFHIASLSIFFACHVFNPIYFLCAGYHIELQKQILLIFFVYGKK